MLLSRLATEEWLERPLKDSRKAKLYTRDQLLEKIQALDPVPKFVTEPDTHQLVCFLLGAKNPGYLFFLDPGGGKTKVSLDLIAWRKARGDIRRALVLVPYGSNVTEWEDEAAKHQPHLRVAALDGSREERERLLWSKKRDVVVITYAGLLQLLCETQEFQDADGKTFRKWVPIKERVQRLVSHFRMLVMDETSVYLRNHTSLTFRILKNFQALGAFVYGLTGTPFNDDPSDFWSQFYLVDGGETLGPYLAPFREAFFDKKPRFWGRGFDFKFRKSMEEKLHRMMAHHSIYYEDKEMCDLPPLVGGVFSKRGPMRREVRFAEETWSYYEKIIEELKQAQGNFTLVEGVYHRLRQLTAGYLAVKDPEGERIAVKFKKNPKLEALTELLQEIPKKRQILVFCVYHTTGDIIMEGLRKAKAGKVLRLYGKTPRAQRKQILRSFKAGKARILLISEAGAYGLNLQAANYGIFYESPSSPIVRKQMEKRLRRRGQTRRVYLYDLVVRTSIDVKILKALRKGRDLFEVLVGGKKRKQLERVRLAR